MRLWSLHPSLLDSKGLVACWRESLLAQKVLAGKTQGYRNHPQLLRLRTTAEPLHLIGAYLEGLYQEALERGYHFDETRILHACLERSRGNIPVTSGQLAFEYSHLLRKLQERDPVGAARLIEIGSGGCPLHPLFRLVEGAVEPWEKTANR